MSQRKFNRYHYNTKQENLWGCCQDETGGCGEGWPREKYAENKNKFEFVSVQNILLFFAKTKQKQKNRNFGKYILKQNSEADENTTHKTRRLNLKQKKNKNTLRDDRQTLLLALNPFATLSLSLSLPLKENTHAHKDFSLCKAITQKKLKSKSHVICFYFFLVEIQKENCY